MSLILQPVLPDLRYVAPSKAIKNYCQCLYVFLGVLGNEFRAT